MKPAAPVAQQIVNGGYGLQAILGGSDSTATVLTSTLFYLATHSEAYARLQGEIDAVFVDADGVPDATKRAPMPSLNACMRKRDASPAPSRSLWIAAVGPAGLRSEDHWRPRHPLRNTSPRQHLEHPSRPTQLLRTHRLHPLALAQSRIQGRLGLKLHAAVLNPDAYHPFSFGPANCVGKNLALMEIRTVVFRLLHWFRVSALPGSVVREWEGEVQDWHIVKVPELYLHVETR
ncbi:hypothetical protein EVG20_g6526 [Dentipellis fragilis]|uniref:Cytochrome P450 n=1 Tax=Dentipellis fragilis TaxID=205917 RepID=A0A4Y9YM98_9AGAM|nr:hypothetical protein EVG20_g6526 [Dentipellis fragilis]